MAHSVSSGERLREALLEFTDVHEALGGVIGDWQHPKIVSSHAALDRLEKLVGEFLHLYEKNQHDLHDRDKELASARRELVGSAGSLGTTHNFLQFDEFITRVHQFNSGSKAPSLTPLIEKLADLSSLRYSVGKKEEKTNSRTVAVVVNALVALCLEAAARYVAIHRHTFAAAAATVPVGCPTAPVPAPAPAGPAQPPHGAAAAAEYAVELRPSPAAVAHVQAIPLFTSTWRKLCEAVFADVFAFPRMADEVVGGPFAAFLAATFPDVGDEVMADRKLRDAVTACAAEACYLGAWCEVSNSHIRVAVPAVLPPGSLVPREAPVPAPTPAGAAARDAADADPVAWLRHSPHSGKSGFGRMGALGELMGYGGADSAAPALPPLPEGWLRVEGVPYGPAEGPEPVPLTLPALRKDAMSLVTYDFEFEDEVDKRGSHVVYPVGLVIRLRKGEGEAGAEAGGAGMPAAAAPGCAASADGDDMGYCWGGGVGGRPAAAAAPAAALPPVVPLFGSGRFAITAPALALHSTEAGKRKVQVLPGMTRAPALVGGANATGRPSANRAGAAGGGAIGGVLSAGGGGWTGDEDGEAPSAYGGGLSRAGASGRVVSGSGGGFVASAAARSGTYAGACGGRDAASPVAGLPRASGALAPGAAAASAAAATAAAGGGLTSGFRREAMLAGLGGVRHLHGFYGDDVAYLGGMDGVRGPSAAAAAALSGSGLPVPRSSLRSMVGGGGGGRDLYEGLYGRLPSSAAAGGRGMHGDSGHDNDAADAAYEKALAALGEGKDAEHVQASVSDMRGEPAADSPAPAPTPAAAARRAPIEPSPAKGSAEASAAGARGPLEGALGPSGSGAPRPSDRLHSRYGHDHHHHGAAAAADVRGGLHSDPGGIFGAAAFGGMYGPSAPLVGGSSRRVHDNADANERTGDDSAARSEDEEEDDEMPSLQHAEADAADAVICGGSGRHAHAHLLVHGSGTAFAAPAGVAAPAAAPAADPAALVPAPSCAAIGGAAAGEDVVGSAKTAAPAGRRGSSGVVPEGPPAAQRDDTSPATGGTGDAAATPAAGSTASVPAPASTHPAQPAIDGHSAAAAAAAGAAAATAAAASAAAAAAAALASASNVPPPDEVIDTPAAADSSVLDASYSGVD
jgi:hypothetical protein